ncbi:amidohydrolase [Veillonella denticariosi JCM 15641]|uniref:Amidohydrolase n=1 Tax=Veillonella denticariosi JCM 15641 TaxID=1298594 RepID=A0A2S7Z870_9FIRM|nr:amidohydrolase [Veillonella denticariosi]PQL19468.1 amidohydrolase [Veillonella denticariosi JCM 15641]
MHSRDLIEQYKTYVQEWRRYFHRHPELSNEEFETTKTLAKELESMGVEVHVDDVRKTGLIGIIRGAKPGKAIGLRADIDALPVQEHNTCEYKSEVDGKMHACGHDGHMAILLGAAKMLMQMKDRLEGDVYLVFQPAEETGGGAPEFIKFGDWFEKIDAIFGGHVWIDLPAGLVSVEAGERMAASSLFSINVKGKQGHGAQPHQAVDAVVVASAIVLNLQTVVSRNVSALDSVVVTIGNIHSGSEWNVIPGEATMGGTVRFFDPHQEEYIVDRMRQIVEHTALAYGAEATLTYEKRVPPTINDESCSALAEQVVIDTLGADKLSKMRKVMPGEDFAWYLQKKPGCFAFIGIQNPDVDAVYDHHNNRFNMDDSVLSAASAVYAEYAIAWLQRNK